MMLTLEEFAEKVHHALRLWRSDRLQESPLEGLLLVKERVQAGATVALAMHEVLDGALNRLESYAPDAAQLLRERFFEGITMDHVAHQRGWGVASLYNQQKEAIVEVARILERQEAALRQTRLARLHRDLQSLSTAPLVGVAPKVATLLPTILRPTIPWLLSLTGEGGIGKSSLAEAVVQALVLHGKIDRVVWISAKQEMLSVAGRIIPLSHAPLLTPSTLLETLAEKLIGTTLAEWQAPEFEQVERIQTELRQHPHLLVVDNLETIPNLATLVPLLRRLVNPTKILLTSRVQLPDEGDIFVYPVPPLTELEVHQLLLQEAQLRGISALMACDARTAARIYQVVGGNPLAVRLVAGQIGLYGLESVLSDLRDATGLGEQLYRFLYEWTWSQLTEPCRQVLVAMVITPEQGSTLAQLMDITRFSKGEVKRAVEQLVAQNLLHIHSDLAHPTYAIHNLTRTFLQEAILKW